MQPLSKIGKDTSQAPLISDFRVFSPNIVELFNYQPRASRMLSPYVEPLQFDGKTEHETPTVQKIGRPEVAMKPHNSNKKLHGSSVIVKTPQIFHSTSASNDDWKLLFAGKIRTSMILGQLMEEIKNEEDYIAFQGVTSLGLNGLVSGTTNPDVSLQNGTGTDLGNPAGNWYQDSDGDGILENFVTDVNKARNLFASRGIPANAPIDCVITNPIFNLLQTKFLSYSPEMTNIDLLRKLLNGGMIINTDNVQAPKLAVDKDNNTALFIVRTGDSNASWHLLSSGFEQKVQPDGLWNTEMGLREKFSLTITRGDLIAWMDAIVTSA